MGIPIQSKLLHEAIVGNTEKGKLTGNLAKDHHVGAGRVIRRGSVVIDGEAAEKTERLLREFRYEAAQWVARSEH